MLHGFETSLGPMQLRLEGEAIAALEWADGSERSTLPVAARAEAQLTQYLEGRRTTFDLPLAPQGSAFQLAFYDVLLAIPFGQTRTYGDIAAEMGVPAQAIGQACGGNPIPILIPCHRVLGANGLGGFSARGGVETKVALLKLEGAASLLI